MRDKKLPRRLSGSLLLAIMTGIVLLASNALKASDPEQGDMEGVWSYVSVGGSWLGVALEDVTAENMGQYKLAREQGAIVKEIEKDSPAERAGLRENDVILTYADVPILSVRQLRRLIGETPVGRTVTLTVSRDGSQQTLQVKMDKRSHKPSDFRFFRKGDAFDFGNLPHFGEKLVRPRLGVTLQSLTEQMGEFLGVKDGKGVLITSVAKDSPAAKAGLKAGDVVVEIDNAAVESAQDLHRALSKKPDADQVTLKIIRDKRSQTIPVQLEARRKQKGLTL